MNAKTIIAVLSLSLGGCHSLDRLTQGRDVPQARGVLTVPMVPAAEVKQETFRSFLIKEVGDLKFTPSSIDQDVKTVSLWVTTNLEAPKSQREVLLERFKGQWPDYFKGFLQSPEGETSSAFCQRSSLSLAEILSYYGVRTKQVHAIDGKNNGVHQFVEYRNPTTFEDTIIDPDAGVTFINHGKTMNMGEIKTLSGDDFDSAISVFAHVRCFEGNFDRTRYLNWVWHDLELVGGLITETKEEK